MKHIHLITLLFLSITYAMNSTEKLKHIPKIIQNFATPSPQVQHNVSLQVTHNPCIQAINNNDSGKLTLELIHGADVNYSSNGKSLFYRASAKNNRKILAILITHKDIDLNARNDEGETPLHLACQLGLTKTVAYILKKSPHAAYYKDKWGSIPLHCANKEGIKTILNILSYDTNIVNQQNSSGQTPLHLACRYALINRITLLVQKGASTTIQDYSQQTPLYELLDTLLPNQDRYEEFFRNIDQNIWHQLMYLPDHNNNTQLHLCATMQIPCLNPRKQHTDFLRFLVAKKMDIAAQNNNGETAFDLAYKAYQELQSLYKEEQTFYIEDALKNQEGIVRKFLQYANPFPKENTTITTQKHHINANNFTTYKDLSEAQQQCLKGVEKKSLYLIKKGLSKGANINFYNQKGDTLLSQACQSSTIDIIKQLLLNEDNRSINHQNSSGDTVLHNVFRAMVWTPRYLEKYCTITKLLIAHAADTTIQNSKQQTPLAALFYCDNGRKLKTINYLLNKHPDILETLIKTNDKNDNTQFHLYISCDINLHSDKYIPFLKSQNLDIHARNKDGKRAIDLISSLYHKSYNRYMANRFRYYEQNLYMRERIYHAFLRATELLTPCASLKNIFEQQNTNSYVFPQELIHQIIRTYYAINIDAIIAKKYAGNNKYYNNTIDNKNEIREQLLKYPEPKLFWSVI